MDAERERRLAGILLEVLDLPAAEQGAFLERACGGDRELFDEARACLADEGDLGDFLERPAAAVMDWGGDAGLASTGDPVVDVGKDSDTGGSNPELATTLFEGRPRRSAERSSTDLSGPTRTHSAEAGETIAPGAAWHEKLGRRWLGAYRIVGLLGEGGMGQVYVGEDERLGRRVAVKILPREMAGRADLLERFEREARALAALNHPNIVTIHSIEQDGDIRFLTMELVSGHTLQQRIADGQLPVGEILSAALDLSAALAAAHARGVVHRDLKPANVMITDDGRVKILDFGIAKLASLGPSQASLDGMVIGTIAYMAPEQLESGPIDARTDFFALGMVLYQTATGKHPFPARSSLVRAQAILGHEPVDPRTLRPDLPPELGAIIVKCLEKEPARRYPDADTLHRDLAALEETRRAERILRARSPWIRRTAVLAATLLVALALAGAILWRGSGSDRDAATPVAVSEARSRTSLAVLPFQNLTGDRELAWLSEGIAELLVTDLAQSPGLTVFGRAEVHRLLAEGDAPSEGEIGPGVVQALARRGDLQVVVRGSYALLGGVLRVTCLVEDPLAGEVLRSASFEGAGEESLFGTVDRLGGSVLEIVGAALPELSPATVAQATTSSIAAWQAYVEAQKLYLEQSRTEEAIARLDAALELDPDFALAAVTAAKMHQSLGRSADAQAYSQRAFERVDHLPLRIRFKVEGDFYGSRWATLGRAIETYAIALKIYPGFSGWHNNLARRYAFFERYPEALEEFGRAIDSGSTFWGNVYGAANVHAALGDWQTGSALLREALTAEPDHWLLAYANAWHLTDWGRFDEATAAFDQLAPRRPGSARIPYGRWRLALLRDDLPDADAQARRLLELDDSFARWRGHVALARNALYRGRAEAALDHFSDAVDASSGADRALARCFRAELQLTLDDPAGALEQARRAEAEGAGQWPELKAIFLAARAEQALGRDVAADRLLEQLRDRWRRQPNAVEERQLLHLTGLLALKRGDAGAGRAALERAVALLPTRGVEFSWHVFPDHVPLWVDLGEAELTAGRPAGALVWLERAAAAGAERLEQPVPYVRGLYLAGLAHQQASAPADARLRFERFLASWQGGELHRDWLDDARSRLDALGPAS